MPYIPSINAIHTCPHAIHALHATPSMAYTPSCVQWYHAREAAAAVHPLVQAAVGQGLVQHSMHVCSCRTRPDAAQYACVQLSDKAWCTECNYCVPWCGTVCMGATVQHCAVCSTRHTVPCILDLQGLRAVQSMPSIHTVHAIHPCHPHHTCYPYHTCHLWHTWQTCHA